MHTMIIEDEYDTHESIVDLNVILVSEVNMIVDKKHNNLNSSLLVISELKIKKLIMHFEMH